jgi:uncharacterized iron-regulated protein
MKDGFDRVRAGKQAMTHRAALPRRSLLGWGLAGLAGVMGGCAHAPGDADDITVSSTGARLPRAGLLARLRDSNYVLLGEQHDNADHHRLRAELMAALPAPVTVVVEYLPRGAAPVLGREPRGDALLHTLEGAGFDARSWHWPLHEPLFLAIAQGQHALHGGNLPRDLARRTAREGATALPPDLRALIDAAPLPDTVRNTLLDNLLRSHCGHLGADRMPNMLLAQRGRDAAMAAALREARARHPGRPVLLLAGNGHVRRDHGVAQLLPAVEPGARVLSVGFVEAGDAPAPGQYDLVWTTPASSHRPDPCAAMAPGGGGQVTPAPRPP